jgi:3-oxoacyl-[acyl-carrier-protein] synthase II
VARVAITGIGLVTPLGVGTDESWRALVEGRTAVGPIQSYDASSLETRLGAEVPEFKPRDYVENRRSLRTMTRHDILSMVAAKLAVEDSGCNLEDDTEGRNALFTAGNKQVSDPDYFSEASVEARDENGQADIRRFGKLAYGSVHPLFFIEGIQGASLFYVSEAYNVRGPNTYFSGTAEAGSNAIARGFNAVRRGEADVALCGASDSPIFWWHMAAWDTLGVTTRRNDLGAAAIAPYDRDRDGTVMGEGGAYFVLEGLEAAQGRGAKVYAEIVGTGAASDTGKLLTPDPSGRAVAKAVERALARAGASPSDVGYVAAHGTGTEHGDRSEAAGLRQVIGENGTAASTVKAATGHLIGAAGAVEAIFSILAMRDQVAPPTLNLDNPSEGCDIDLAPKQAKPRKIRAALSNSFGFGGTNASLIFTPVQ